MCEERSDIKLCADLTRAVFSSPTQAGRIAASICEPTQMLYANDINLSVEALQSWKQRGVAAFSGTPSSNTSSHRIWKCPIMCRLWGCSSVYIYSSHFFLLCGMNSGKLYINQVSGASKKAPLVGCTVCCAHIYSKARIDF